MEHLEALQSFTSDMLAGLVNLEPLHVLGGVAVIAVVACFISHAKDSFAIVLSAALYAIPFLLPLLLG